MIKCLYERILTINSRRLLVLIRCESKVLEHIEASNSNTLAAFVLVIRFRLNITPMITSASVQEHRNEEEINQATCNFFVVSSIGLPLIDYISDTRHIPDFEMLPSTMRWNRIEFVRTIVTLMVEKVSLLHCEL